MSLILKGVGRRSGDGWKDTTKVGEVIFAYGRQMLPPYAPGQFPRVGCTIWSASTKQFDFYPASVGDVVRLLPLMLRDLHGLWRSRRRLTPSARFWLLCLIVACGSLGPLVVTHVWPETRVVRR